jgi:hypothetical protein
VGVLSLKLAFRLELQCIVIIIIIIFITFKQCIYSHIPEIQHLSRVQCYSCSEFTVCATVNLLKPELKPSAQRCLTRFFIRDFAS